jgi:nitrite reductase (NADH) large subunit
LSKIHPSVAIITVYDIKIHLGDKAVAIDKAKKFVTSAKGVEISYDKLVLATGSYAFVPPVFFGYFYWLILKYPMLEFYPPAFVRHPHQAVPTLSVVKTGLHGISVLASKNTQKIVDGTERKHKMLFADGTELETDIILFSAGIHILCLRSVPSTIFWVFLLANTEIPNA